MRPSIAFAGWHSGGGEGILWGFPAKELSRVRDR